MSGATMSGMISVQMDASSTSATTAAKPTGEDIAAKLVQGLDTDGDGDVSADEINAAFKAAGIETSDASTVADAVKKLDTDGSGTLSTAELGTAIDAKMAAHKGHHGHHGGGEGGKPPSAGDVATSLLSSLDSDQSSGLSLSELLKGMDQTTAATDSQKSAFASLDADGDGSLNATELTSAITAMMQNDMASYAQNAYSQSASIAA